MKNKDLENKDLEMEYQEKVEEIEKKEKKKRRRLWIVIIILIILLLLLWFPLFMLGYRMAKIQNIGGDINVNAGAGIGTGSNTGTNTDENATNATNPMKIIQVRQKDIDASLIEDLDIFVNEEFNNQKVIAPLSKGSYNFQIENLTEENIIYNIKMAETNPWNINLKYRFKIDNIYIIGNEQTWADIEDLHINNIIVPKDSENLYTIEWYWEEADNDTEIGKASNVEYKLTIDVNSSIYNGEV